MKILNRDVIKYIAMLTMLMNHIANVFLTPGTLPYEALVDIGYFTAVTMCYFLVEGYGYTRSKKKYGRRLLIFAALSQIPYDMAFSEGKGFGFTGFNMIFTLFLCFILIWILDQVKDRTTRITGIILIFILAAFSDWSVLAPVFVMLFVWAGNSQKKKAVSFLVSMLIFFGMNFLGGMGAVPIGENLMYSLFAVLGIGVSGIVILYLYNGKRMNRGRIFSQWFFYLFYPVHLLVIGGVRIFLLY